MSDWFYRKGDVLHPCDEDAQRRLRRMHEGEACEVEIERSRSYQWHKMFVAICKEIGQNQDPQRDWSSIDYELRIASGHFEVQFYDDIQVRVPKRIAFHKLTADQWAELWPRLDLAMQERFGFDHTASRYAA